MGWGWLGGEVAGRTAITPLVASPANSTVSQLDKWPVGEDCSDLSAAPHSPQPFTHPPPPPPPVSLISPSTPPLPFFSPAIPALVLSVCFSSESPLPFFFSSLPPQLIESCLPQTALISAPRGLSGEGGEKSRRKAQAPSGLTPFRFRTRFDGPASLHCLPAPSSRSTRLTLPPVPSVTYHLQKKTSAFPQIPLLVSLPPVSLPSQPPEDAAGPAGRRLPVGGGEREQRTRLGRAQTLGDPERCSVPAGLQRGSVSLSRNQRTPLAGLRR